MESDSASGRTICVLGFHRSGTSLTARVLNALGVYLGEQRDLLPADVGDNPHGYWEPQWAIDINDEILASFGGSWWQTMPAAPGWEHSDDLSPLLIRAKASFEQKLGHAPLRGWKDPRTALTLPFWRQVVPDQAYVICLRNPVDAIASLQRRPEPTLSMRQWSDLWLEYTARAVMETAAAPRLLVFYEDFFTDPRGQVERLAKFVSPDARGEQTGDVAELIDHELRHHSTSPGQLANTRAAPAGVRTTFLALRAAEALRGDVVGPDTIGTAAALERTIPDLWWASVEASNAEHRAEAVGPLETRLQQLREALEERNVLIDQAQSRHTELAQSLAATEEGLRRARAAVEGLQRSLSWRVTRPLRAAKHRFHGRST